MIGYKCCGMLSLLKNNIATGIVKFHVNYIFGQKTTQHKKANITILGRAGVLTRDLSHRS